MAEILPIRRKALKNVKGEFVLFENNNIVLHVPPSMRKWLKDPEFNVIMPFQKALLRVSKRRILRN